MGASERRLIAMEMVCEKYVWSNTNGSSEDYKGVKENRSC